jgi:hypothetical protein
MVCKKNTGDLYWFGPRNARRPVGEESSVLSCTEVLVVEVISIHERGRSSQVSRHEWRKWVCATLLVASQGPGELSARVLRCVVAVVLLLLFRSCGMIPACFFYRLKEVQGYKMLAYGVTLLVEEPGGLGKALSGGNVVSTVEAWRRYFWHYCYVFWRVCHC